MAGKGVSCPSYMVYYEGEAIGFMLAKQQWNRVEGDRRSVEVAGDWNGEKGGSPPGLERKIYGGVKKGLNL